jgi:hypothetical protein
MEWFTLILGDTSDNSPSVISPSYGKILLEKNLLQLITRSDRVRFQRLEPMFGSIFEGENEEMHL